MRGKFFAVLAPEGGSLRLSVKLPGSSAFALMQPWTAPTGYGLGKSGWVTAAFARTADEPADLLED